MNNTEKTHKNHLNRPTWAVMLALALTGQIAWAVETRGSIPLCLIPTRLTRSCCKWACLSTCQNRG